MMPAILKGPTMSDPVASDGPQRRRVRLERLGIGAAVGLVLLTAMGSAWMMLLGAGVGLIAALAWEMARPGRSGAGARRSMVP